MASFGLLLTFLPELRNLVLPICFGLAFVVSVKIERHLVSPVASPKVWVLITAVAAISLVVAAVWGSIFIAAHRGTFVGFGIAYGCIQLMTHSAALFELNFYGPKE